jgi:trimethylamine--corrinoid protein Co-methyltransferase
MIFPDLNFKPRSHVLSDEQLEQIHFASLEILERIGVQITNKKALEILHGAGARVIDNRVYIPSWLVEHAIETAPPRVVLGNRKGNRVVFLEGGQNILRTEFGLYRLP